MIHLLDKAGARRIRIAEGCDVPPGSLEEWMYLASWDVNALKTAAKRVEFYNTNIAFPGSKPYSRFKVPGGGLLFPAYDLNTVYDECDVLISMTKLKEHTTAGVTIAMKNLFGMTPSTIYGNRAGIDDSRPFRTAAGRRSSTAAGASSQAPARGRSQAPAGACRAAMRDVAAARPADLSVIEAIETMAGGEGPWSPRARPCSPGVMFAGTNMVTVDAVGTALMGFDPMADRGTAPFERCDSTLKMAEELGLGTRDLKRIEVIGTPIAEAKFNIRAVPGGERPAGRG
jgi:hypothetical protein